MRRYQWGGTLLQASELRVRGPCRETGPQKGAQDESNASLNANVEMTETVLAKAARCSRTLFGICCAWRHMRIYGPGTPDLDPDARTKAPYMYTYDFSLSPFCNHIYYFKPC